MKDEARAVLRRFERGIPLAGEDGVRSAASLDQVSPFLVIMQAYSLWAAEATSWRPEEADRVAEVVRGLFSDSAAAGFAGTVEDATVLTQAVFGDFDAAMKVEAAGLFTLHNVTALLNAVRVRERLSEPELDALLARAEGEVEETLRSGERTRPQARDGRWGPWDVTESADGSDAGGTSVGRRIDLGALRIPILSGMRIRPEGIDPQDTGEATDRACGVTLHVADAYLQLQVFSVPEGGLWDRVRGQLVAGIAARGGTAREAIGPLGPEVRGTVPDDESGTTAVRFVGCDGPGWMLRGVLTGLGADSDIIQEQARRIFVGAVVDIRTATPLPNGCVPLHWPPLSGWDDDTTPLFD